MGEMAKAALKKIRRDRLNGHVPRKRGEPDEAYNARRADILQNEVQALARKLVVMNDLAYIIECVALNITGEAKSEINALIAKLEGIESPAAAELYKDVCLKLGEARACLSNHDCHRAASVLSSISRSLWSRIVPPC